MKFVIFVSLFLFVPKLFADFSRVIMVKGQVSYLGPGMTVPKWVTKGMVLKEDTSLVTRKKSVIRVQVLENGSYVTLGPNSKLVLTKVEKKKGSVVSLLNGLMRSKVKKIVGEENKDTNKLYIKTRNAALGVRGTEFITVVNQKNKVTSLVTLEGKVAMSKLDSFTPQENVTEAVKAAVDSENVTVVKKGRASTSYLHKEELTKPTKVNPVQLVALKKNEELVVKDKDEVVVEESPKVEVTEKLKEELYGKDEEEVEDKEEQIPENGAVVDLNSAIFIPEIKDDKFKVGKIDPSTGQYVPTEGIKLDPVKGFVAVASTDNSKNEKAKKLVEQLNKHVEYKELPKGYIPGHSTEVGSFDYIKPENNFKFKIDGGMINFNYPDEDGDRDTDIAGVVLGLTLDYERYQTARMAYSFTLGTRVIQLNKKELDNSEFEDDGPGFIFGLGHKYNLSNKFSFLTKVYIEEIMFPVIKINNSAVTFGMTARSVPVPKLQLGVETQVSQGLYLDASYFHLFSSDRDNVYFETGNVMKASVRYHFKSFKKHFAVFTAARKDFRYNDSLARVHEINFGYQYQY